MSKDKTYILFQELPSDSVTKCFGEFGRYPSPADAEKDIKGQKATGRFILASLVWERTARTEEMVLFDEPQKPPRKKRGPNKPKMQPAPVSPPLFQGANGEPASDPGDACETPELERKESVLHNSGDGWAVEIVGLLYSDGSWGICRTATLGEHELSGEVSEIWETRESAIIWAVSDIRKWASLLPAKAKRGDKSMGAAELEEALKSLGAKMLAEQAVPA